jgi:uncharacterized 2Fe-2S/4Fe-4S cluster protein (DUF4445 family)
MMYFPDDFVTESGGEGLGAAFDIGTTTVVGMLWDLKTGRMMDILAETNPQNKYGADVISRITYCGRSEEKLAELSGLIRSKMNDMLDVMCTRRAAAQAEIRRITVCGNTTMSHLAGGYDPMSLALVPFTPAYEGELVLQASDMKITAAPGCTVTIIPNLAGHVGGDINAGIVASRLLDQKELTLFIDIGTNGEMALTDGERTLVCSTAAGPAFEGACISQGMRASTGAIEKVEISGSEVTLSTIDNGAPVGICGSGLISAVSEMLRNGVIDATGRMDKKHPRVRLIGGKPVFVLAEKPNGDPVGLTQKDIREVQLAKGAMQAGASIMLKILGRKPEDIRKVMLAGAFGNFIDREAASRIGLLPRIPLERIEPVGNTAGAGISMVLMNREEAALARGMAAHVEHVELAAWPEFDTEYMNAMSFA